MRYLYICDMCIRYLSQQCQSIKLLNKRNTGGGALQYFNDKHVLILNLLIYLWLLATIVWVMRPFMYTRMHNSTPLIICIIHTHTHDAQ